MADLINEWVSQEFQNLAQVINDYDHNLFLEWVPPEYHKDLIDKSKVFRIIDGRTKTIVMHFDSLSSPTDILTRLWSMDQTHGNPVAALDARNAAERALKMNKWIEEQEARKDLTLFIAKNTKSRWVHEGRIRDDEFRDLGPKSTVID